MITKDQFTAYERVRKSGKYCMGRDSARAMRAAKFGSEIYWQIVHRYSECMTRWPEVRKEKTA